MILLTGGMGFLGRQLVDQLLETSVRLRLLVRQIPGTAPNPNIEFIQGDLADLDSLRRACQGVQDVYHLAGKVDFDAVDPSEMLAVNHQGARNLFQAALEMQVRKVVHVSSVSTIGGASSPDKPLTEDDFGLGEGVDLPYPMSKRKGEEAALEFADRGLPVTIVNPTFFCGPGDVHLSSACTIVSFAKGQVWVGLSRGGLGYTDVRDVAHGCRLAMEKGVVGRRYILGGQNLLLHEYHELLAELCGRKPPWLRLPPSAAVWMARIGVRWYWWTGRKTFVSPGHVRMGRQFWFYDYSRARQELGLTTRPAKESLSEAVQWLRDQRLISV